ncbi:type VI secretion system protein TssL, long form [Burkholderia ubonensis]|uniref:OmpA-like domain-containing protein n=1 Tax=Burkholderia ubonensis TaxID=101571 RepID=A0A1R1JII1_9BURK|nr:type VI secretion system protein TssL, long form [Burkholderia ubonensis]OMG75195.1 hypothetical protein BW685_00625 [Burkholderia ubonensis]
MPAQPFAADAASPAAPAGSPAAPASHRHEIPPGETPADRLDAIAAASNPLLEAARPLLRALSDIPDELDPEGVEQLRNLLEQEVRTFQQLCAQANIRRDHMLGARYCLCTALDEAASQTSWGKGGDTGVAWATHGLATIFHEDRHGGDKVYLLVGRLMAEPQEHIDLLEIIYRIFSLGFEGRYRYESGGHRKHEAVRQRLYNEIMSQREAVPVALSPHWQSDAKSRRASFVDFPVWVTVVLLSLVALGLFGYFKYELLRRGADVQRQIADIRSTSSPHAAPEPARKLRTLLEEEIAAGTVSVDESAHRSSITLRGDAMFAPGSASINAAISPVIVKIAGEIAKVAGKVTVLGYTDNVPIRSPQFASNDALSMERATQVAQILQASGVPASRLEAIGKGDADPVGDNRNAMGRAQNRRVEIVVAQ